MIGEEIEGRSEGDDVKIILFHSVGQQRGLSQKLISAVLDKIYQKRISMYAL